MLNGTTAEVKERSALRINPAKTCQPIGAMYAALGVHGCMPHSHGSQGCCSYHRSQLTRHFKEPVIATSSSFTEGSSVFGGMANFTQAIQNIFGIYNPEIVAAHTTCLSEVIGDDMSMMIKKSREEGKIPEGKEVVYANTPSFVGSNITGFSNMVVAFVKQLAQKSDVPSTRINLIPGYCDAADVREIKRIAAIMGVEIITLPDVTDVLDLPQTGIYEMYPKGGTRVADIRAMGDSTATIALGKWASHAASNKLEDLCSVPAYNLELPIGIAATDEYVDALRQAGSSDVPRSLVEERGRLLDTLSDMSQYIYKKRVALAGDDPDHIISMTRFLVEMDMVPAYVITGGLGNDFEKRVREILKDQAPNAIVKAQGDLFELHQWMKQEPVDLLIGSTHAKYIARAENNLPFVRFGFPILDRIGHRYFPSVGYMGGIRMVEKITDALFDKRDRESAEEWVELVL